MPLASPRARLFVAVTAGLLPALALLPVAPNASAATRTAASTQAGPAGPATVVDLKIPAASSMIRIDSRLFVAAGDTVRVYGLTGTLQHTVTGQAGVRDLVASADGGTVYAALRNASAVSAIDVATATEKARFAVPCATHLARAEAALFVSYGCGDGVDHALGVLDTATGTLTNLDGESRFWSAPPRLAATGGHLAAIETASSPATVVSYAVSGSTISELAHQRFSSSAALAFRPDGSRLAIGTMDAGYAVLEVDPATLEQTAAYVTGPYPQDAAYSPDGSVLVGSQGTTYDADLAVFSTVDGGTRTRRQALLPGQSAGDVLPFTTTFGADGSHVYALVHDSGTVGLATISTTAPLATSLKLSVGSRGYGQPLPVTVTVHGRRSATVVVGDGTTTHRVHVGSSGHARTTFRAPFSGSLTATLAGDADYAAASAAGHFTARSRASLALSGGYRRSGGVTYFHGYRDVLVSVRIRPGGSHGVVLRSQLRRGGHWVTSDTATLTTGADGTTRAYLISAPRRTTTRFTLTFSGDASLKGSRATSVRFRID